MYFGQLPKTSWVRISIARRSALTTRPLTRSRRRRSGSMTRTPSGRPRVSPSLRGSAAGSPAARRSVLGLGAAMTPGGPVTSEAHTRPEGSTRARPARTALRSQERPGRVRDHARETPTEMAGLARNSGPRLDSAFARMELVHRALDADGPARDSDLQHGVAVHDAEDDRADARAERERLAGAAESERERHRIGHDRGQHGHADDRPHAEDQEIRDRARRR